MYFIKDRPDLLHLIKRKAHSRTEGKSKALPLGSSHHDTNSSSAEILSHSEPSLYSDSKQRQIRHELDRRLGGTGGATNGSGSVYEDHNRRLHDLEAQQSALVSENLMLKRVVADMKFKQEDMANKTEGVLKLLYHMLLTSVPHTDSHLSSFAPNLSLGWVQSSQRRALWHPRVSTERFLQIFAN
jgi:hypothetical protein